MRLRWRMLSSASHSVGRQSSAPRSEFGSDVLRKGWQGLPGLFALSGILSQSGKHTDLKGFLQSCAVLSTKLVRE